MASNGNLKKVSLSTNPDEAALASLELGNVVYLNGVVYTAREGAYMKVVDDGVDLPLGGKRHQLSLFTRRR